MESLKVAFILAAIFSIGSGRTITSEESSRDTIEGPEISSFDASSESTTEVDVAAVNMAASSNQITTRRKRSLQTPEPSCFKGTYKMIRLPNGFTVKEPVCFKALSDNSKCTTQACQKSHYLKINIGGGTFKIATNCSCQV